MRIDNHPILGKPKHGKKVTIYFNGKPISAYEGEPIAAALYAQGIRSLRKTAKLKKARGVFCAIGRCTDCVMVVYGIPNVRTCVTEVREGIKIKSQEGLGQWKTKK